MSDIEILDQLKSLTPAERLRIVESTVHQLREDMGRLGAEGVAETDARLTLAAKALLGDYSENKELTVFTALLDGEAVHAWG